MMCLSSPGAPRVLLLAPSETDRATPHPGKSPQPQPKALCRDKAPGVQGHGHGTGRRRERAASTTEAPQSVQEGLGTYQGSRPPRPATAAALSGASAPSPAPCPGAARAALWDKGLVRAVQPGPGRPQPRRSPARPGPRTLHDVAELAEIAVAPGAIGLYGPVEVELQDPAVHGLLGERRHPGPVGVGLLVPLVPRRPTRRRHPANTLRAGSDATARAPLRAGLSRGLLAYNSQRASRQPRRAYNSRRAPPRTRR